MIWLLRSTEMSVCPARSFRASSIRRSKEFFQVKLLDQFVLHAAAVQDADEHIARALQAEQIASHSPETSGGTGHRRSCHRNVGTRLVVRRHQTRCGRIARWDKKSDKRAGKQRIGSDAEEHTAICPEQLEIREGIPARLRRLPCCRCLREVALR